MSTIAHSINMPQERRGEQGNGTFMNMLNSIPNHQRDDIMQHLFSKPSFLTEEGIVERNYFRKKKTKGQLG